MPLACQTSKPKKKKKGKKEGKKGGDGETAVKVGTDNDLAGAF